MRGTSKQCRGGRPIKRTASGLLICCNPGCCGSRAWRRCQYPDSEVFLSNRRNSIGRAGHRSLLVFCAPPIDWFDVRVTRVSGRNTTLINSGNFLEHRLDGSTVIGLHQIRSTLWTGISDILMSIGTNCTNGSWLARNSLVRNQLAFARKSIDYKHLKIMEAGSRNILDFGLLKTRNLLIFQDAKNVQNFKIAPNWNVSGTRIFGERWDLRELAIGSM